MSQESEELHDETEMLIECDESLDVSMVFDFKSVLSQAASQNLPITIDAAKLERVDGAALQLLSAFVIEVNKLGQDVSWKAPSEALLHAAKISGLTETLQL